MKLILCCLMLVVVMNGLSLGQEKKKVEPCADAQSQAEMNICWGKEYKKADVVLNQVYRQLVDLLDEQEKGQLKEAQTAWLKFRDLNCEFVADQYKGGSIRPAIHATCLLDVTTTRTNELKSQIKDRKL
jgi:uncharacterized protein YecT (DUF1311 family)